MTFTKTLVAGTALAISLLAAPAAMAEGTPVHASWYGSGRQTANGERFNPMGMTAAHRTLPFDTRVRVTTPKTGRSIVVRINDRGPFIRGRQLDLAKGAARALGMGGTATVLMARL